jgi:hypothetical protein
MSSRTVSGVIHLTRMAQSKEGNPRYSVTVEGLGVVGSTRPNGPEGYRIGGFDGRPATLTIQEMRGRPYVVRVERPAEK